MKATLKNIRDLAKSADEWNDWHWQIRNRIDDFATLSQYIELTDAEKQLQDNPKFSFRMAITPYYLSLINQLDPHDPVRMQAIPHLFETVIGESDMADPLHEDGDSPVPGLTHRYPDRVLLLLTDQCSMYCRHCTRRRLAGETDAPMPKENIQRAIEYIANHTEIHDVILSGGDPLTLSDQRLDEVLAAITAIKHINIIRIGSRTPVVMPQRITDSLAAVFKKYKNLWFNTHFNHPNEMTPEAQAAVAKLVESGVPVNNQSVLLKGVNDHVDVMKNLVHTLLKNRIRPYYIYQCDLSQGIGHFRTPVSKGLEIIESLRGHTSGLAVPTFVVDAPGGGGKIPVQPNYVISQAPGRLILRNYEGFITTYTEPHYKPQQDEAYSKLCPENRRSSEGVMSLIRGHKVSIGPAETKRHQRSKKEH